MFKYTTAIKKLRAMTARKKVIQGGTSAGYQPPFRNVRGRFGKTYGILPVLIDKATKDDSLKITIVAETLPAVKEGSLDIFKTIMHNTNRWIESHWNASSLIYTFSNKSRIQFKSFDSVGKAKSSGKRDILFLNEANHIPFDIADALMIRSKETWIDYNPDNEFWVHKETLKEHNSEFLLLTYHDNEALPKETLEDLLIKQDKAFFDVSADWKDSKNIKSSFWANWCYVYILGEIGNLEGVIFNNYTIIESLPNDAKYTKSGMDFGYTNDPSTCIDEYYYNSEFIYDEVLYEKGLVNSEIAKKLKKDGLKRFIIADSAEPKSIQELKNNGLIVKGATKGADSIQFGIQAIQEEHFYVTSRSINLINELRKYAWQKDKQGKKTNIPIDSFNHCIDPIRYIKADGKIDVIKVRSSGTGNYK